MCSTSSVQCTAGIVATQGYLNVVGIVVLLPKLKQDNSCIVRQCICHHRGRAQCFQQREHSGVMLKYQDQLVYIYSSRSRKRGLK